MRLFHASAPPDSARHCCVTLLLRIITDLRVKCHNITVFSNTLRCTRLWLCVMAYGEHREHTFACFCFLAQPFSLAPAFLITAVLAEGAQQELRVPAWCTKDEIWLLKGNLDRRPRWAQRGNSHGWDRSQGSTCNCAAKQTQVHTHTSTWENPTQGWFSSTHRTTLDN